MGASNMFYPTVCRESFNRGISFSDGHSKYVNSLLYFRDFSRAIDDSDIVDYSEDNISSQFKYTAEKLRDNGNPIVSAAKLVVQSLGQVLQEQATNVGDESSTALKYHSQENLVSSQAVRYANIPYLSQSFSTPDINEAYDINYRQYSFDHREAKQSSFNATTTDNFINGSCYKNHILSHQDDEQNNRHYANGRYSTTSSTPLTDSTADNIRLENLRILEPTRDSISTKEERPKSANNQPTYQEALEELKHNNLASDTELNLINQHILKHPDSVRQRSQFVIKFYEKEHSNNRPEVLNTFTENKMFQTPVAESLASLAEVNNMPIQEDNYNATPSHTDFFLGKEIESLLTEISKPPTFVTTREKLLNETLPSPIMHPGTEGAGFDFFIGHDEPDRDAKQSISHSLPVPVVRCSDSSQQTLDTSKSMPNIKCNFPFIVHHSGFSFNPPVEQVLSLPYFSHKCTHVTNFAEERDLSYDDDTYYSGSFLNYKNIIAPTIVSCKGDRSSSMPDMFDRNLKKISDNDDISLLKPSIVQPAEGDVILSKTESYCSYDTKDLNYKYDKEAVDEHEDVLGLQWRHVPSAEARLEEYVSDYDPSISMLVHDESLSGERSQTPDDIYHDYAHPMPSRQARHLADEYQLSEQLTEQATESQYHFQPQLRGVIDSTKRARRKTNVCSITRGSLVGLEQESEAKDVSKEKFKSSSGSQPSKLLVLLDEIVPDKKGEIKRVNVVRGDKYTGITRQVSAQTPRRSRRRDRPSYREITKDDKMKLEDTSLSSDISLDVPVLPIDGVDSCHSETSLSKRDENLKMSTGSPSVNVRPTCRVVGVLEKKDRYDTSIIEREASSGITTREVNTEQLDRVSLVSEDLVTDLTEIFPGELSVTEQNEHEESIAKSIISSRTESVDEFPKLLEERNIIEEPGHKEVTDLENIENFYNNVMSQRRYLSGLKAISYMFSGLLNVVRLEQGVEECDYPEFARRIDRQIRRLDYIVPEYYTINSGLISSGDYEEKRRIIESVAIDRKIQSHLKRSLSSDAILSSKRSRTDSKQAYDFKSSSLKERFPGKEILTELSNKLMKKAKKKVLPKFRLKQKSNKKNGTATTLSTGATNTVAGSTARSEEVCQNETNVSTQYISTRKEELKDVSQGAFQAPGSQEEQIEEKSYGEHPIKISDTGSSVDKKRIPDTTTDTSTYIDFRERCLYEGLYTHSIAVPREQDVAQDEMSYDSHGEDVLRDTARCGRDVEGTVKGSAGHDRDENSPDGVRHERDEGEVNQGISEQIREPKIIYINGIAIDEDSETFV